MKKYILILLIFGIIGYNYIYQDHRDIATEPPKFTINSKLLLNQFSENPSYFQKEYLNKVIEVSGLVTEIDLMYIVLNEKIFCHFKEHINSSSTRKYLSIKGRFIGYDDLLDEIKLDQCKIILEK
jgi:hypothetical protein